MARRYFGRIGQAGSGNPGEMNFSAPLYASLGTWVEYQPLREGSELDIVWPLVGASRCGLGAVVNLLSQPYPGSPLAQLKRQGLATSLSWSLMITTKYFSILRVNVKLTELTQQDVWKVVQLIYSQIEMLKSLQSADVTARLLALHRQSLRVFVNREREPVHHFVKNLSARMSHAIHPAYYLSAPSQPSSTSCYYDTLLNLRLDKSIFLLGVHDSPDKFTHTEPWYEIPYTPRQIALQELYQKLNIYFLPKVALIPAAKQALPAMLPLFDRDADQLPWPSVVHQTPRLSVWWQQDAVFHLPKTNVMLWVYTAEEHGSPRDVALHYLLVEMTRDQLADRALPSQFKIELFYQSSSGLVATISGYSDHEQMKQCVRELVGVLSNLDLSQKNSFNRVVRYRAHNEISRADYAEAYKHPLFKSRVLLEQNIPPLDQILSSLSVISLESFAQFYRSLRRRIGAHCLVYGNVMKWMAEEYSKSLESLVTKGVSIKINPPFHPTLQYPVGTYYTRTPYPNSKETASVADLTTVLGPTPWNSDAMPPEVGSLFSRTVLARVAAILLEEPAFNTLRTNQQLGYSVFTKYISHFGMDYIHLCVQGSEHDSVTMATAILRFLKDFRIKLPKLLRDETSGQETEHWSSVLRTVKHDLTLKPTSQYALALKLAAELFSPDPNPDLTDLHVAALETVTPESLLKFYDQYILAGNHSRRIISLAQSKERSWNLDKLDSSFTELDYENKTRYRQPFLYWHFTYLGIEMGK